MNILFDHQTFSRHDYGGVPRYFAELISGINKHTSHHAYLPLLFSNTVHLNETGIMTKSFFPNSSIIGKKHFIYGVNSAYNLYELYNRPFDIYHATYYHSYFSPYLEKKPFIVTFFDMIHERFAGEFPSLGEDMALMKQKKKIAHLANRIIAISESTKNDIVDFLNIDPNKIDVVYLGSSLPKLSPKEEHNLNNIPYLLFVGKRNYYKNFFALVNAVHPLLKQYQIKLICAGGGSFTKDESELLHSFKVEKLIEYNHIASDDKLQELYQGATAFLFPTLYEGFGIPILEAFASGCPCVISDRSSLPEVAGEAALYIDPTDTESIRFGVERIILDDCLRANLTQRGYERLSQFSWEKNVHNTIKVYENALNNK